MEEDRESGPEPIPDTKLAFVSWREMTGGGAYQGGALVTDAAGKPLEFRSTSPVRPTMVQRTLYGSTLMPHITQDLFALPLIKSLRETPTVVLIQDEALLDIRPASPFPVLCVRRQGATMAADGDDPNASMASAAIDSPSGRFDAVVVSGYWAQPGEVRELRERLRPVFARMDLLEPFERINRALEVLEGQERDREQGR